MDSGLSGAAGVDVLVRVEEAFGLGIVPVLTLLHLMADETVMDGLRKLNPVPLTLVLVNILDLLFH